MQVLFLILCSYVFFAAGILVVPKKDEPIANEVVKDRLFFAGVLWVFAALCFVAMLVMVGKQ
jgi:hypothetical protein